MVDWVAPSSVNGYALQRYQVYLKTSAGTWIESTEHCPATDASLTECQVPMTVLRAAPYSLSYSDNVVAKVRALNARGWSAWSTEGQGATVLTEPQQMSAMSRGSLTSKTQIELDWTTQTTAAETGGSSIVSHTITWNQGSTVDEWVTLAADVTGSSYIVDTGITTGETYLFKISSKNIFGFSEESTLTTVIAAIAPSGLSAPTTTYNSAAPSSVVVDWSAPSDDGGLGSAGLTYTV